MPAFDTPNAEIEFSRPQIASWCLGLGGYTYLEEPG